LAKASTTCRISTPNNSLTLCFKKCWARNISVGGGKHPDPGSWAACGTYLAKRLVHEGYAVTAIEPDSNLIRYTDGYLDARLIQGSAMSIDCWREANAENIDVLIAVTDNDAVNMLAAMIADRFGIPQKIARVRSTGFWRQRFHAQRR
jgi:hypothetical protein